MGRRHQAEVVDAGRLRGGPGGLGHGGVGVAADDQRRRHPGGAALGEHVDGGQVLGVEAQLDAPADQGGVNRVVVTVEAHRGGAGHLALGRPAERLGQAGRVGGPWRPAGGEAGLGGHARAGVGPAVGDLVDPGPEAVVELVQALDADVGGLGHEPLPDVAVQSFLLAPALGRVGRRVDKADAQHRAGAGQHVVGERRPVVRIEHLGQAPAHDGGPAAPPGRPGCSRR